jgi:hypothetical protein
MNYFLRGIDEGFWHRVRTKALSQKKSIREVIFLLLKEWVNGKAK